MWNSHHPNEVDDDSSSDHADVHGAVSPGFHSLQPVPGAAAVASIEGQYRRQEAQAHQPILPHQQHGQGLGLDYGHQQQSSQRGQQQTSEEEDDDDDDEDDDEDAEDDDVDDEENDTNGGYLGTDGTSRTASGASVDQDESDDEDDDDDDDEEDGDEEDDGEEDTGDEEQTQSSSNSVVPQQQARGKPEAMAKALASKVKKEKIEELDLDVQSGKDADGQTKVASKSSKVKVSNADKTDKSSKPKKKRKIPSRKSLDEALGPSLDDNVPALTDKDYSNLEAMMVQFCRVPLLAEFSRPVTLLHPELTSIYSKIVSHPVDLGKVCRQIARRQYKNSRDVQLDMWRIFANCVKYHSHPSNKEGVPFFVSISLHLRDYFNSLWQEFMIPSDPPVSSDGGSSISLTLKRTTFAKREEDRKKRLGVSGLTPISVKSLQRTTEMLEKFIDSGLCVDGLDESPFFDVDDILASSSDSSDRRDLRIVVENLIQLKNKLGEVISVGQEYSIEEFDREIKECYSANDVLEDNPSLRVAIGHRVNRLVGKLVVPIHEANCRGVTQSCIWGCMAAVIWARESSKKPYWPALVLGILAPEDQREEWHGALTERNEMRLPEKLRTQLTSGKRKAEQALTKQSQGLADPQSYFLVEFLGTHEFIWVRESDIIEEFDENDDPNQSTSSSKKSKRASRASTASVIGSKTYITASKEAKWAMDEFELQLQDPCGDMVEEEEQEGEEMNYSYSVLCVSDDEADEAYAAAKEENEMSSSDVEEANELLATQGLLDFSATGRKNAKKRALAMKKLKAEAERKEKAELAKKAKAEQSKKKKDSKSKQKEKQKVEKDMEIRRKKRVREREKVLKKEEKKTKRRKSGDADASEGTDEKPKTKVAGTAPSPAAPLAPDRKLMFDKRARATAIVKAYLYRMADRGDEYKNLGLNGVMTIPAAMVDSSGLLGMALAFRAAAGELSMPDDSGDQDYGKIKPWDTIDVDGPKKSSVRQQRLEKQVALLEKEIKRVKAATATRKKLCEEEKKIYEEIKKTTAMDDKVARQNHYKKKKKYVRGGSSGGVGGGSARRQGSSVVNNKSSAKIKRETNEQASNENDSNHEDAASHDDEEEDADADDDDKNEEHAYSVEVVSDKDENECDDEQSTDNDAVENEEEENSNDDSASEEDIQPTETEGMYE